MTAQSPFALELYNRKPIELLLKEFEQLRTFAEVEEWDGRAGTAMADIAGHIEKATAHIVDMERRLDEEETGHKSKSIVGRLFDGRSDRKLALKSLEDAKREIESLTEFADRLDAAITATPNDKDEQKALMKDLKQRKKELAIEKKEAAAAAKEVRAAAQQAGAKIGTGLFSSPSTNRYARMSLRLKKEAALRPHENQKAAIERQIINVEKMINWVERFGE